MKLYLVDRGMLTQSQVPKAITNLITTLTNCMHTYTSHNDTITVDNTVVTMVCLQNISIL